MSSENVSGFLGSVKVDYTVQTGDGSALQIDLKRPYSVIVIRCEDCTNIPDSTTLSLWTKLEDSNAWCELYEMNDPSTKWSKGVPTSGTMQFALFHAFGAKQLRLDLSANVSGGQVVFQIYGFDPIRLGASDVV